MKGPLYTGTGAFLFMKILGYTFSPGNLKLGKIWNISHTPIQGCMSNVPCANTKGCYALKAYLNYPSTRKAWDSNYYRLLHDRRYYPYTALIDAVVKLAQGSPQRATLKYFRIHVAGDFLDQDHLDAWKEISGTWCPTTKFRAFTKRHDLSFKGLPDNLKIGFSMWPGWDVKPPKGLPVAWLKDKNNPDPRIPKGLYVCPGSCSKCKHCWNSDKDVVLVKH